MIEIQKEFEVQQPPLAVFDLLDDLERTPQWNVRCVEVRQVSPGPRGVGTKLQYVYRDPQRSGTMDGEITEYERGRALAMRYADPMISVAVSFHLAPAGTGTRITHQIRVEPRTLMVKLMTPMIRGATEKQTAGSVAKLTELLRA